MPEFKFKLQTVLEVKKRIEDGYKKELSELKSLLKREEMLLIRLDERKYGMQELIRKHQDGDIDLEAILNYYNYLSSLKEQIMNQMHLINELISAIEQKRQDVVAAAKERKIMEKLKDNQYKDFLAALEKLESKVMDEIATDGYNRKERYAGNKL